MVASLVELFNLSLDLCRATPIMSPGDQAESARLCDRNWPSVRDAVLRGYRWNCALRRASLPAAATAPAFGYARAFPLPEGPDPPRCLRVIGLHDSDEPWEIEGRTLLTDAAAPLAIRYVAQIDDPTLFDPLLVQALAARLAAQIAPRLIESQTAVQALGELYSAALAEARRTDAQESGAPETVTAAEWLDSREF